MKDDVFLLVQHPSQSKSIENSTAIRYDISAVFCLIELRLLRNFPLVSALVLLWLTVILLSRRQCFFGETLPSSPLPNTISRSKWHRKDKILHAKPCGNFLFTGQFASLQKNGSNETYGKYDWMATLILLLLSSFGSSMETQKYRSIEVLFTNIWEVYPLKLWTLQTNPM